MGIFGALLLLLTGAALAAKAETAAKEATYNSARIRIVNFLIGMFAPFRSLRENRLHFGSDRYPRTMLNCGLSPPPVRHLQVEACLKSD